MCTCCSQGGDIKTFCFTKRFFLFFFLALERVLENLSARVSSSGTATATFGFLQFIFIFFRDCALSASRITKNSIARSRAHIKTPAL